MWLNSSGRAREVEVGWLGFLFCDRQKVFGIGVTLARVLIWGAKHTCAGVDWSGRLLILGAGVEEAWSREAVESEGRGVLSLGPKASKGI